MVYSIVVPPVSVRDLQEEASGEEREPNRGLFFSGSGGPVPIQRLDFSADPTRLYSSQESESAVGLVTHPDYGVVLPVGGEYTCLAVNQFGNFTQDINVNIRGEFVFFYEEVPTTSICSQMCNCSRTSKGVCHSSVNI